MSLHGLSSYDGDRKLDFIIVGEDSLHAIQILDIGTVEQDQDLIVQVLLILGFQVIRELSNVLLFEMLDRFPHRFYLHFDILFFQFQAKYIQQMKLDLRAHEHRQET
jgi:hypothetical protein